MFAILNVVWYITDMLSHLEQEKIKLIGLKEIINNFDELVDLFYEHNDTLDFYPVWKEVDKLKAKIEKFKLAKANEPRKN